MKHSGIDTGILRAYLDHELGRENEAAVAGHIASCHECQAEVTMLNNRSATIHTGLDSLPDAVIADGAAAWNTFRVRMNGARGPQRTVWTPLRIWSTAAAGLVATVMVVVVTVAPLRAWAENLLSIFRVERVAVVDIGSGMLKSPDSDILFNQAVGRIISEEVIFTQPPQKSQSVPDTTAASKLAGFSAHLISSETPSRLMVSSGLTAQMKLDRDRLQTIVNETGRTDLQIPPSVDGAVIGMRVPAGIMASYGNCADATGESQKTDNPTCVKLSEMPSPTASVPDGLNAAGLAQVALEFAGLSATEAANFTQTVDWTSTFVLPVMHRNTSYEQVTVNGNDAVLLRPRDPGASSRFNLIWVDNGMLYSLMGTGDDTTAQNLASRIE